MNIILLGKSGLIGSAVYNKLIEDGHNVTSFGRGNCDYPFDMNDIKMNPFELKAEALVHCAGVTDEEIKANYKKAIKRNTLGLVNLVDFAVDTGVNQFVYISSVHVYGNINRKINENTIPKPKSLYGNLHLFAENYIRSRFDKTLIIRPSAVFGNVTENFNRWGLIPFSFPMELAKKKKIIIRSHGKQYRNFISVKKIAKIISINLLKSFNGAINPIGYYSMSIRDFAEFCIKNIKEKVSNNFVFKTLSKEDYLNKFEFTSIHRQPQEEPEELPKHIIRTYNNC